MKKIQKKSIETWNELNPNEPANPNSELSRVRLAVQG